MSVPCQSNLPEVGVKKAGNQMGQGGFSCAIMPDQTNHFSLMDGKIQCLQNGFAHLVGKR